MEKINPTSIAFGCDEAAFRLKKLFEHTSESWAAPSSTSGVYNTDPSLYPDIAEKSSPRSCGRVTARILMCGTGIGMAITANKVPGVPRISRTEAVRAGPGVFPRR